MEAGEKARQILLRLCCCCFRLYCFHLLARLLALSVKLGAAFRYRDVFLRQSEHHFNFVDDGVSFELPIPLHLVFSCSEAPHWFNSYWHYRTRRRLTSNR